MKNVIKHVGVVLCLAVCAAFSFAIVGCSDDTYTDEDDYANFVRWQARYETEKELVALLREYDKAYKAYTTYIDKISDMYDKPDSSSIAFVFEGRTILTDENISLASVVYDPKNGYSVSISFDDVGTAILADFTANHIGGTLTIIETRNGNSSVISSAHINGVIADGNANINGSFTKEDAEYLCLRIWFTCAERNLQQAAVAYNEKRAESAVHYSTPNYLPTSLAVEPQYIDVSAYLHKAEAVGFTA